MLSCVENGLVKEAENEGRSGRGGGFGGGGTRQ